ncbi:GNAT family N-acetyltransferase [Streptomyces sp. NBC_00102]|uniref:GNAT family N-acetyltransferase n=1 Tax=Streptomyces sp. NBC_00102 TaxID=2975652 RepID=UPI0022597B22|nr:GNAT family N-acetyltransferase [Streptomyces sp. NBC_00102]MCX5401605.1 GNAT family N-acetyltransferase [Streptomyces sp. NBC_00102]
MNDRPAFRTVRLPGAQVSPTQGLTGLLTAYHLRTEEEKGLAVARPEDLPERYLSEIRDPASAFAGSLVLSALHDDTAVGCAVLTAAGGDGRSEIKRLWVEPAYRGGGVASGLIREALSAAEETGVRAVRLSVWHWRAGAIALYVRHGFTAVESWEDRQDLVCMERRIGL